MTDKNKVLIFGARGFIGQQLVNQLIAENYALILVTSKSDISDSGSIFYVNTDRLFSKKKDTDIVNLMQSVAIVINCAGEITDETKMQDTNVDLVKRILELVVFFEIEKFIHLGSAGIYRKKGVISVKSDIEPDNVYEQTKWEADKYLFSQIHGIQAKVQILRPTTVISNKMRNQSFLQLLHLYNKVGFLSISNPEKTYFHYVPADVVVDVIISCVKGHLAEQLYLVSTDLSQDAFIRCLPRKLRRIYIPYFLLLPLLVFKIHGISKARIMHLRDRCSFVSNIEGLNDINFKENALSRVIKTFDVF